MSNQEIELHIKNLYNSVNALAGKTYKRESSAESDITRINSELTITCQETTVSDIWNETNIYEEGDYVIYEGHLYRCLIANFGVNPSDSHYWLHTSIVNELNYLNDRKVDK